MEEVDIVVAGGGLAGLLAARETSAEGLTVKIFEDNLEVGLPEKCDGLVSVRGLKELGIIPSLKMVESRVKRAVLHSPEDIKVEVDASQKGVVVFDRSELDLSLARAAVLSGAMLELGNPVVSVRSGSSHVEVESRRETVQCRILVDARGVSSLASDKRKGLLQAAKYIVAGENIADDTVEIFFNQEITPSFFTWLIPAGEGLAKLGCAGAVINGFRVLDEYVEKLSLKPIRKIASSIYVGGPLERFVKGRLVSVGDAAGQTKPTTAGGIYSGGVGGMLAGRAAAEALKKDELQKLQEYEDGWRNRFQKEFETTALARRIFQRLDNHALDKIFSLISKPEVQESLSKEGDFDFHSSILPRILGAKDTLKVIGTIASSELRRLTAASKHVASG